MSVDYLEKVDSTGLQHPVVPHRIVKMGMCMCVHACVCVRVTQFNESVIITHTFRDRFFMKLFLPNALLC